MEIATLEELNIALSDPKSGLFLHDMDEQLYRSHSAVSQSELKVLDEKTPRHLEYQRRHPRPPSETMRLGTACHTAILEPEKFDQLYMRAVKIDKRKKGGPEAVKDLQLQAKELGKMILVEDDYDTPWKIRDAILSNPEVAGYLKDGVHERSSFARVHGVLGKCRKDYYQPGFHRIVDLKTAHCASDYEFAKSLRKYRYNWQDAWYGDIVEELTGERPDFVFIVVENSEPYCSQVFRVKNDLRMIARREMMGAVQKIRTAMETGIWTGYPARVVELGAHKWEWDGFMQAIEMGA